MATFSDDFSTHSTSEVATFSAPTGVTGWTLSAESGSQSFISASIVTDAGAIGGKVLRLDDTGWGNGRLIYPTAIGSLAASTAAEVLVGFKFTAVTGNQAGYIRQVPAIIRALADMSQFNGVGFELNTTKNFRAWYYNAGNDWNAIGAAQATTITAGQFHWIRLGVTSGGSWNYRFWQNGSAEPADAVSGVSETTQNAGYCGIGGYNTSTRNPIDVQWFGVGTAGSSAPGPAAAADPLRARRFYVMP